MKQQADKKNALRLCTYLYIIGIVFLSAIVSSCQGDRPDDVLSRRQFERVLYDYHLAEALGAAHQEDPDYYTRLYTAAALRKHDVSQKQFDASMKYYIRHADELYEIYNHLAERLASEGGATDGRIVATLGGDTTDIWTGSANYLLYANGQNFLQETLQADTVLQHGDQLLWTFNTQWVYLEGAKTAAAVIAVRYANDSTAVTMQTVRSTGRQELSIFIGKEKPVSITCLLYQEAAWNRAPKFLVVSQPQLIRIRAKRKTAEELKRDSIEAAARDAAQTADTLSGVSPLRQRERHLRDSLLRTDTLRGHHFK